MTTDNAQLFTGIHHTPVYTNFLGGHPLRVWVAVPAALGVTATLLSVAFTLDSGHPRDTLLTGLLLTALATGIGALVPRGRPSAGFRAKAIWVSIRPRTQTTTTSPLLAKPKEFVDNLWFAANGAVYAVYLLSGLSYHLQPARKKTTAANLHALLAREVPADSYLLGIETPQDVNHLLRAMLDGHRDRDEWVDSCMVIAPELRDQRPTTRTFWLAVPVDGGRDGHGPQGQLTKIKDWVAGRDQDSDTSIQAYSALAYDIVSAIPAQFAAAPATPAQLDWLYRHNAWLHTFDDPLPRRSATATRRIDGAHLPAPEFDEGDQLHKPYRPRWLNWLPNWRKVVRVYSPEHTYPDSYQALLPVIDAPEGGIVFPGSEFLAALDDIDIGDPKDPSSRATFDFAINLTARPRELEMRHNDHAKGNIYDQFEQRGDVLNGMTELRSAARKVNEYNRQLSANIDEIPLGAAFLIHVGAASPAVLDYAVKRVKEELTQSGQIVIRHYRGAQTRLWSAFNIGTTQAKSGLGQFAHPTTATKWSRFVPLTTTALGTPTGMLLGFNTSNAKSSAVLVDLAATAGRNKNPCLVCNGAPGYGKSYTAKRVSRDHVRRGAQAFIIDPDDYREWETAFADVSNKAVVDMSANNFGCDALRIFPDKVAGSYWLDYMIPMIGLDPHSTAVRRLRPLLTSASRRANNITSTAALMRYIAAIQAPETGTDQRSPATARLGDDLRPVLIALQSWATYDFTTPIFDDTLPVPDLHSIDVSIWNTGSLDLPDAEEMSTPHLYASLSDRQRASVAIYSMIVRLARITFFSTGKQRFGLIVLEEAGALLNSRAGAKDAHLISRRARKHYTGMIIITQNMIKDLELMGAEFITQQLIFPVEDETLAKAVAERAGVPLAEHEELVEYFLAEPDSIADPAAVDDIDGAAPAVVNLAAGRAFMVDEFRRIGPIRIISEPDPALHHAYDTTPAQKTA